MASGISDTSHSFNKDPQSLPYSSSFLVGVQSRKGGMTSGWLHDYIARLTVTSVKAAAATLNMEGYGGDWYFKQTAPSVGDCTAGGGTTHALSGLSPGTAHGFTAYWDGSCADAIGSVTFTTPASLTVSAVQATSVTLNLAGHDGQWWYDADTGPHTSCQGPVAAGTKTADLTGLTVHQQYTYKAYSATDCNDTYILASITFEPSGDVLTAESVTATTATLKLENHTGGWWFKRTAPDAGTCTAGEADFTNDLTGLIPGTEYTYKAYDVSTCGDTHESASVDFTTGGVSVSNLNTTDRFECFVGSFAGAKSQCATGFTTGGAAKAPNGYTLHSITIRLTGVFGDDPGTLTVALHEASGDKPAINAINDATMSGTTPSAEGTYTYICSGAGCQLEAGTTYFVALTSSATSGDNFFRWRRTQSKGEVNSPSDNGWSIADISRFGSDWSLTSEYTGNLKIASMVNSD